VKRVISIVTPSFNQLNWLRLCVSSITDQTAGILVGAVGRPPAFAVEHIIQDAGSAGIEEFAKEVGANFHNGNTLRFEADPSLTTKRPHYSISIYSEPDRGMYDAINKGLAKATGDICAWLNSDEQYLDGTLQKVAEYFRKDQDLDVLLGDAVLVDERFDPLSYRRIVIPNKWHTRLSFLHSLSCAMFFRPRVLPNPACCRPSGSIQLQFRSDHNPHQILEGCLCRPPEQFFCFRGIAHQ
jgi:glycosyltransferase involved in cell wall biosynthesis